MTIRSASVHNGRVKLGKQDVEDEDNDEDDDIDAHNAEVDRYKSTYFFIESDNETTAHHIYYNWCLKNKMCWEDALPSGSSSSSSTAQVTCQKVSSWPTGEEDKVPEGMADGVLGGL
jgi:hypothetical protein